MNAWMTGCDQYTTSSAEHRHPTLLFPQCWHSPRIQKRRWSAEVEALSCLKPPTTTGASFPQLLQAISPEVTAWSKWRLIPRIVRLNAGWKERRRSTLTSPLPLTISKLWLCEQPGQRMREYFCPSGSVSKEPCRCCCPQ